MIIRASISEKDDGLDNLGCEKVDYYGEDIDGFSEDVRRDNSERGIQVIKTYIREYTI